MLDAASMFSLAGKSALVTGAAGGLGYAIAEVLSCNGAAVTLLDLNLEKLEQAAATLRKQGRRVRTVAADITDERALRAAFSEAASAQAGIDIVFANAGIDGGSGFGDWTGAPVAGAEIEGYDVERWKRTLNVNLDGAFFSVREAARHMRARRFGRIILTSSATAETSPPTVGVSYLVAKAGLAHLMRQAAHELAPVGITVNAIAPGIFDTGIKGSRAGPAALDVIGRAIPIGRVGAPSEIQGLALFLASDASAYLTGVHIPIDGGYSLRN